MTHIVHKLIKGHVYDYLYDSVREGNRVRSVYRGYIGKSAMGKELGTTHSERVSPVSHVLGTTVSFKATVSVRSRLAKLGTTIRGWLRRGK